MDQMLKSEFERQKNALQILLKQKFGAKLSIDDIDFITDTLGNNLNSLIQLVKEGKSAHEKFFSDIILNSIDAIIGLDNDFRIFLWNKGAENIFEYKREEVMHKDFSILLPDHKIRSGEKEYLIDEVKRKGFLVNYESERITKTGKLRFVNITRFAIHNESGDMIGSVGIIRDVTDVKTLEKELRERENLALIGEVVSSIAHSLSNPLNIISGNADYLLLDKKKNEKEYEELKTILDEATRITRSIRHLLNFSREVKVIKEENDINGVINEVVERSKFIKENKKLTFKKNLKNIPGFKFDKAQIFEVISNIVTNSVQAIQSEGEIKINSFLKDGKVILEISDSGSGIEKENLEKIFVPFYSSKEYGKGTGLGLPISKKIVKEHGGEISVRSTVGKGSKFVIMLPAG
jgi:PAS domain S-box-containing protein